MEQTGKYGLSQWDAEDRILREDFNADNAKIEAALALLGSERVITGSYVGDATANRIISLPFTPKFVIVMGYINSKSAVTVATAETDRYVTSDSCGSGNVARIIDNGFQVGMTYANWHNETGKTEYYIAVR